MKRRMFLSTTGTIGIIGAASGASVVSSAYTSFSTSVSLAEFSESTKTILNNFIADLAQNIQELNLNDELVARIATPVRIIRKNSKNGNQSIVYKNKSGKYISLSSKNGIETIHISNSL